MSLKRKKILALVLPVFVVLVIDQVTKHWIRFAMEYHRHEVIDGWLALNYTQNPGMAMGMDWLSTPVISGIAILATLGILLYVIRSLEEASIGFLLCMGFILGGALGNITDRLIMGLIEGYGGVLDGHVIDFIHFTLAINNTPVFPYIFNIADTAISTSIIVMILFYKRIVPESDVSVAEVSGESGSTTQAQGSGISGSMREHE